MTGRIFQSALSQMKDSLSVPVGIADDDGLIITCTDSSLTGTELGFVLADLHGLQSSVVRYGGYSLKALKSGFASLEYVAFTIGEDDSAANICALCAIALDTARLHYDEKYDKATFVKNILLDNVLPGDIRIRGKELRFENGVSRVVFLVRQVKTADVAVLDIMQGLFPDKQSDYVMSISDSEHVLVKSVADDISEEELHLMAQNIDEAIKAELMLKTVIGIGSPVPELKDLATSYKEAQIAIEVSKVFDKETNITNYACMGIGRLIYQLPITMCEMYLAEVFKKSPITALDSESIETICAFFDNSLNVSETSRKLFVHRNTLVYRLDKIKRITGLDLRLFDHSIEFKVALMVQKYLQSQRG